MDEANNSILIYLPALHPELVPNTLLQSLPTEVFFMASGLEGQAEAGVKKYISPNLVYNPKQANACLNALINLRSDFMEDLSVLAAQKVVNSFWGSLSELESDDLKAFVANEGVFEPKINPKQDKLRHEVYEQAQKNLILAWSHEEDVLAIAKLLKELGQSSSKLAENLGDPVIEGIKSGSGSSVDAVVELISQEIGMSPSDIEVQWVASLSGALCLTPPDTFFYTNLDDLNRLLAQVYSDEKAKANIQDLDAKLAKELLPEASLKQKFKVCEIPFELLLLAYTSPLLQRLAVLNEGKRKNVTFIFPTESCVACE